MNNPESSDSHKKYTCPVNGCGKSFQRKEHLTRHERAHNPETLFVCKVCKRKFNRSDSLLRHLSRHGDTFKPNPSGRSKRACISCHAGKIKCDGNQICSKCLRRGIECRYRPEDLDLVGEAPEQIQERPILSSSNMELASMYDDSSIPIMSDLGQYNHDLDFPGGSQGVGDTQLEVAAPTNQSASIEVPPRPKPNGLLDWTAIRVIRDRSDPERQGSSDVEDAESDSAADPFSALYLDLYYTYFHHRWPILHRASFDQENCRFDVVSSMKMIGAWLTGRPESRKYAINIHDGLVARLLPRLHQLTSYDSFEEPSVHCLCQASLLNIVFGLYTGHERILSRAMIMRNTLVAVLREVGLFRTETVWRDEKPGYFLPLHLVRLGLRQRMAVYLFKIDIYLAILRGQPALTMPEELHYTLPSAHCLWNGDGLDKWEARQATEPLFRSQKSILHMINDSTWDSEFPTEEPLLIEDLQLCICALQSNIWRLSQRSRDSDENEISTVLQKDSLRRRLDALKLRLEQMAHQNTEGVDFGDEKTLPLRHYFGYEDQSQPGWQGEVIARVKSLSFDGLMLYHLFSLHLLAEVGTLTQLAKDQNTATTFERHRRAREQRLSATERWTGTPTARQALCHAVEILVEHQAIFFEPNKATGLEKYTLDPISYIALSCAALVVWAYCTFSLHKCDVCTPRSASTGVIPVVELTEFCGSNPQQDEKDSWLAMRGRCGVQLQGIQLCQCNMKFRMTLFRVCMPEGWEVADTIAPGVFKI